MNRLLLTGFSCFCLIISACSDESSSKSATDRNNAATSSISQTDKNPGTISNPETLSENDKTLPPKNGETVQSDSNLTESDFDTLRSKIAIGVATMDDVYDALTEQDVVGITNTMHALHSLRWNRTVYHLYYDLWHLKKDTQPRFAWKEIESIPARIALASTITRAQGKDAEEFINFIRDHKYDEHEFHRAQAVVALGLIGNPEDVDYIIEMSNSDNKYVVQSAITSLGLVNNIRARDELIRHWEKENASERKDYISKLLKQAYQWEPPQTNTELDPALSDAKNTVID